MYLVSIFWCWFVRVFELIFAFIIHTMHFTTNCVHNSFETIFNYIMLQFSVLLSFYCILQVWRLFDPPGHSRSVMTTRCTLRLSFQAHNPVFKHFNYRSSSIFHKCGDFAHTIRAPTIIPRSKFVKLRLFPICSQRTHLYYYLKNHVFLVYTVLVSSNNSMTP